MAETRMLTGHDEIRDWAAARMGAPAIRQVSAAIGNNEPFLLIVFDQRAYEDQDQGQDRPTDLGAPEIVEWDEWFEIFDRRDLGLVVAKDVPGVRESFHEIVAR